MQNSRATVEIYANIFVNTRLFPACYPKISNLRSLQAFQILRKEISVLHRLRLVPFVHLAGIQKFYSLGISLKFCIKSNLCSFLTKKSTEDDEPIIKNSRLVKY